MEIGRAAGMDYQFIVPAGQFGEGDRFVYIPEGAVVPPHLISEMGLQGKLAGAEKNRVKAIKLRGLLSQGLAYPLPELWRGLPLGHDLAAELGLTKYEPPIPRALQGRVRSVASGPLAPGAGFFRSYTEIENIKKLPHLFGEGEQVYVSEKLHGSCCIVGLIDGEPVVSSKGIAKRGLCLEDDQSNTYWRIARQLDLFSKIEAISRYTGAQRLLLFGEVLGVQDLMYDLAPGELDYRAFDLYMQATGLCPHFGPSFLDQDEFLGLCIGVGIPIAPPLYIGPWSKAAVAPFVSGQSTLAAHLREGVVIKACPERDDPRGGRAVAKWVSEEYLTRASGTEYE